MEEIEQSMSSSQHSNNDASKTGMCHTPPSYLQEVRASRNNCPSHNVRTGDCNVGRRRLTVHNKENQKNTTADKQKAFQEEREYRESLVLWRRPIATVVNASLEMFHLLKRIPSNFWEYVGVLSIVLVTMLLTVKKFDGSHQEMLEIFYKKIYWMFYWFGLGVLSSIGLGTGLHTFILYLGPHIASVTLAAYECGGLNFPEPPYPDQIKCPLDVNPEQEVSMWNIMHKVQLESVMWGAGTAFGELLPYFMARTARLSGYDLDNEDDLREFEAFQKRARKHPYTLSYVDRLRLLIENTVAKIGFFGILLCASIPNPLFDLAGITCGHFLVPFWTFFGATLIGKTVFKVTIQQVFVILSFNEPLIATFLSYLTVVPVVGQLLQETVTRFFVGEKEKLHNGRVSGSEESLIGKVFEMFVSAMVVYFIVSIINSLAQSYCRRMRKITVQKD